MFIATLIAAGSLTEKIIRDAGRLMMDSGCGPDDFEWIDRGKAASIAFQWRIASARSALEGAFEGLDVVVQPTAFLRKRMLVADMDSTMITVECIDELADYAGVKAEVAEVTERAMRGELDFETALDARVALLKDLDEAMVDRCRAERVRLMPGARTLVQTMRANGAFSLLVSGGFTRFAEPVAEEIGFDAVTSNELLAEQGRLTGMVRKPIFSASGKLEAMTAAAREREIGLEEVLAVGDGANDIPMIRAAGLGIAYRAKPAAAAAADVRIEYNDLTALLYAQGYARKDWVEA
jgi:phosphoserine phosphatase